MSWDHVFAGRPDQPLISIQPAPCPHCAALVTALENLIESLPMEAFSRSVRLPENDDDGRTVVWRKEYIEALMELRKRRPTPTVDRCALCGGTNSLIVEDVWWGQTVMACPNCAPKPPEFVFPVPPEIPGMFRQILRGLVPPEILIPVQPPCLRCGGTRLVMTGRSTANPIPCPNCAGGKEPTC